MSSLDERIAQAFTGGVTSTAIAELIGEAQAASVSTADATEQSRARALDPAISMTEVAKARRLMEDASFRRERLQEALRRLEGRLREVKEQEEQQRRQTRYDEVVRNRDALADELRREYPIIAAQLSELVARVDKSDGEIDWVNNRALPSGVSRIASAELIARGLPGFLDATAEIPRITKQLRLPSFTYSAFDRYVWPLEKR